ncbi:hypothetical protein T492DRAFT_496800 [Pavlovales sp. CCMP2436]|nr:hypothetical protein T492DRAFT_496800 [Pavlovales sp. CCMP2436]
MWADEEAGGLLDWSSRALREDGIAALRPALDALGGRLTSLDLSANELADAGAVALTAALGASEADAGAGRRLATLVLARNGIGDAGGCALAVWLGSNSSLRSLDLAENRLANRAAVALAVALADHPLLSWLSLVHNSVRRRGVQALVELARARLGPAGAGGRGARGSPLRIDARLNLVDEAEAEALWQLGEPLPKAPPMLPSAVFLSRARGEESPGAVAAVAALAALGAGVLAAGRGRETGRERGRDRASESYGGDSWAAAPRASEWSTDPRPPVRPAAHRAESGQRRADGSERQSERERGALQPRALHQHATVDADASAWLLEVASTSAWATPPPRAPRRLTREAAAQTISPPCDVGAQTEAGEDTGRADTGRSDTDPPRLSAAPPGRSPPGPPRAAGGLSADAREALEQAHAERAHLEAELSAERARADAAAASALSVETRAFELVRAEEAVMLRRAVRERESAEALAAARAEVLEWRLRAKAVHADAVALAQMCAAEGEEAAGARRGVVVLSGLHLVRTLRHSQALGVLSALSHWRLAALQLAAVSIIKQNKKYILDSWRRTAKCPRR